MRKTVQLERKRLTIAGQVQGVGFRPFVYRLAREMNLTGWVVNDSRGVTIEIQGRDQAVQDFARRVRSELPPLAEIVRCEVTPAEVMVGEEHFDIQPSQGGELSDAQVTVDTAVCADCLREMNDPADPRYRYPFINCTNCGPRYTIIGKIPYDRPNTTMADFAMCPFCAGEYSDPGNRRFHAQPVACPQCGPAVWLVDTHGKQIDCPDPIAEAAEMLRGGQIVAIKGLGGFHLACRADDDHVVRRLRQRKHRDAKPFAVMVADIEHARGLCEMNPQAEEFLTGPLRPIVILPRRKEDSIGHGAPHVALSVTEGLDCLGVMLPYTPLHHLLFSSGPEMPPLVMTSGNYSEEPLVKDNDSAIAHLGQIADALLLHNRRIEHRLDDSVVQMHSDGHATMLRRARGYAPQPIHLPALASLTGEGESGAAPVSVLAVGAELKSAVCLYRNGRAVLSEHIGDLRDGRVYRHFIDTVNRLEALFDFHPQLLAVDAHPAYLSSEYATRRHHGELAGRPALPVVRVQHHHAHIASVLAEHGRTGPVIGLACDGVGYGDDGAVWGCEVMRADLLEYERLGHLRYLPLIGGDAAASETYRPALAALHDTFGPECLKLLISHRLSAERSHLESAVEMMTLDTNCPQSSSLGRWFDAVAGLTGVATTNRFEGEAPMMLEASIAPGVKDKYDFRILAGGPFMIDLRPMVEGIVEDLSGRESVGVVAAKFHNTVAAFLIASAVRAREECGLNTVAMSGGCFANRYLTAHVSAGLVADGFEVLRHGRIPCNDGGLSLGQAVVACAREQQARARSAGAGGRKNP